MKRREFITLLSVPAAWPLIAHAQQPKVWRIGFLAPAPPTPAMLNAFRDGLREHGYVEGQNLSIDLRWPQGPFEQNPDLAAELARSNVDVIVAWASPAVIAARRATSTIPIVMAGVGDPVGYGFVASLARPGGNVTGVSVMAPDLSGKLVGLLVEIAPDTNRIGVVYNPNNPAATVVMRETEKAIRVLGLEFEVIEAGVLGEFERAFGRLSTRGVKGVVLAADPSVLVHGAKIAELAQKARLPTAFQRRENVEAGGLLSYGPSLNELLRHTAIYVDRILKGAKPAELPVEQPTKFELVINLKTAKALGLTVPLIMQMTADLVIE